MLARQDLQLSVSDSVIVVAAANAQPGGEIRCGHWRVIRCLAGEPKPPEAFTLASHPFCNRRGGTIVGAVRQALCVGLFLAQGPQFHINLGKGSPSSIKL